MKKQKLSIYDGIIRRVEYIERQVIKNESKYRRKYGDNILALTNKGKVVSVSSSGSDGLVSLIIIGTIQDIIKLHRPYLGFLPEAR